MKKMKWLAPAFIMALAAPALFAGYVPLASLAQQGPGGGCYICGTLEYVLVDGAYWFGIIAQDACPSYLNDPRSSPQARRSYYNQVAAKGKDCPAAERVRNSSYGTYCGENMPDRGFVYGNVAGGGVYEEPSSNSPTFGTVPKGSRLLYTRTMRAPDGTTWYYTSVSGTTKPGWVPGSNVSCIRPQVAPPTPGHGNNPSAPSLGTGSATPVAGARG